MVDLLSSDELKSMTLKGLRKHAKKLVKAGYDVGEYKKVDSEKVIRKMIRHGQKAGPRIAKLKDGLKCGMITNQCLKNTEKYKVADIKALAEHCGIDRELPRKEICTQLKKKYQKASVKSPRKVSPRRKGPKKIMEAPLGHEARYTELNKLPKKSAKNASLLDLARQYKLVGYTNATKHDTILLILAHESGNAIGSSSSKKSSKKSTKSSKKSSKKSSSPKHSHDELLEKRLDELKEILGNHGINDVDGVHSVEHAADLVSELENGGSSCSEDNEFECPSGKSCDISSNPGVCVDSGSALRHMGRLNVNGKDIVGSKEAIRALRRKLGLKAFKEPDPFSEAGFKRGPLLRKAAKLTGKPIAEFKRFTDNQLRNLIEGHDVQEDVAKGREIEKMVRKYNANPDRMTGLSLNQLRKRANLLASQRDGDLKAEGFDREEMIEALASWLDAPPHKFAEWSNGELAQRLDALRDWETPPTKKAAVASEAVPLEVVDAIVDSVGEGSQYSSKSDRKAARKALKKAARKSDRKAAKKALKKALKKATKLELKLGAKKAAKAAEKAAKKALKKVKSSSSSSSSSIAEAVEAVATAKILSSSSSSVEEAVDDAVEVIARASKSSSSSVEEAVVEDAISSSSVSSAASHKSSSSRKKQEDIDFGDVEKVLADAMAGKKGKIEDFSKVQNLVLKCLGVISD